jgi:DnaJ-class molecular chaperone
LKIALKNHPDTSQQFSKETKKTSEISDLKFKDIAEAYNCLSKPSLKSKYDLLRKKYLYRQKFTVEWGDATGGPDLSVISTGYNTQKAHYDNVVSWRASRIDGKDKYKTERWAKMSLKDKKMTRRVPMSSGILLAGPAVCGFVGLAGIFYMFSR